MEDDGTTLEHRDWDPFSEADVDARFESDVNRRIRDWRFEEFTRLGFGGSDVLALVAAPVDLNAARRLIDCGCPPATAAAILI